MLKKNLKNYLHIISHQKILVSLPYLLFFLGIIIGFYLPGILKIQLISSLSEKIGGLLSDNPFRLCLNIFLNNLFVVVIASLFFITILPGIVIPLVNGFGIGAILNFQLRINVLNGTSLMPFIMSLAPHGIIEIPAFLLSVSNGFVLFIKIVLPKKILSHLSVKEVTTSLIIGLLLLITPALLVAAVVETFITPTIASKFTAQELSKQNSKDLSINLISTQDLEKMGLNMAKTNLNGDRTTYLSDNEAYSLKDIVRIIYDDQLYAELKAVSRQKKAMVHFENQERKLTVSIVKFNTPTAAKSGSQRLIKLYPKIYKKIDLPAVTEGNTVYLRPSSKKTTLSILNADNYVITIASQGLEKAQIQKAGDYQIEKLKAE